MTESSIRLDWSCLLGFDHCAEGTATISAVTGAKVGSKDMTIRSFSRIGVSELAAKVGRKDPFHS
jgi:hypothetical protein